MQKGLPTIDHFYKAMSLFKRRKYEECIKITSEMLERNPKDNAAWLLKCKALTKQSYVDDIEIEEEGLADILMDQNSLATAPRPGTSFSRPTSSAQRPGSISKMVRPVSGSGRPVSGYARPGTNRPITGQSRGNLTTAMKGNRPGTTRALTSGGRFLRLGTASLLAFNSENFLDSSKLQPKKLVQKKSLAKAVLDYLLYVENNPRKALEIAAEGTQISKFQDWWWKERLGKCYLKMGIIRDAQRQLSSSIRNQPMIISFLELGKVAIKLDQPAKAIQSYNFGLEQFPSEPTLKIGIARVHDLLNQSDISFNIYSECLLIDNNSIESIACVANHHFYTNQPEIALIYYKRLVQVGVNSAELWNNLGLCCFYASQYDMSLSCFERALAMSDDTNSADIWYNIGQVSIAVGDLGLAYQAFKIAISCDSNHSESFNNLGVLELRKNNIEQAKSNFTSAVKLSPFYFEPLYNGALLAYKIGDYQESFFLVNEALKVFPEHSDSKDLLGLLKESFLKL